jgi:thioredoxin reductase
VADVRDVLVVGGGAAGYPAGIFAARDRCPAGPTRNTFLSGLAPFNERGQIVTDLRMRTTVPGILAAGAGPPGG